MNHKSCPDECLVKQCLSLNTHQQKPQRISLNLSEPQKFALAYFKNYASIINACLSIIVFYTSIELKVNVLLKDNKMLDRQNLMNSFSKK